MPPPGKKEAAVSVEVTIDYVMKVFEDLEESHPVTALDFRALFLAEEYWRGYLTHNGMDAIPREVRKRAVETWPAFLPKAQAIETTLIKITRMDPAGRR